MTTEVKCKLKIFEMLRNENGLQGGRFGGLDFKQGASRGRRVQSPRMIS